jgi:hypothetical protein
MLLIGVLATACLLALCTAHDASAAEVHFDPDSPAGKEYALPLDQARNEATGESGSKRRPGDRAPLFGAGVTRDDAAGSGGVADGRGDGGDGPSSQGAAGGDAPADGGATGDEGGSPGKARGAGLASVDAEYPGSSELGLVVAILAAGACLGLAIRGLSRARSAS